MYEVIENVVVTNELSELLGVEIPVDLEIEGISKSNQPVENTLILADSMTLNALSSEEKMKLFEMKDVLLLVNETHQAKGIELVVEKPEEVYALIVTTYFSKRKLSFISDTAIFPKRFSAIKGLSLGHHVVISDDAELKEDVSVMDGSKVYGDVLIGRGSCIKSNTVVGNSGFGVVASQRKIMRVPHVGSIQIGSEVVIGNLVTIECPLCLETSIHDQVSIDDNCHIGSGAKIMKSVSIAAGCVLGQDVEIGEGAVLEPGVKVASGVKISKKAVVGMGSVVLKDVAEGRVVAGVPAKEI